MIFIINHCPVSLEIFEGIIPWNQSLKSHGITPLNTPVVRLEGQELPNLPIRVRFLAGVHRDPIIMRTMLGWEARGHHADGNASNCPHGNVLVTEAES